MKILVLGDIILDKYTHVKTDRFCQEAPICIYDEQYTDYRLGGAANVANNLVKMSKNIDVYLAGITNNNIVYKMLKDANINSDLCFLGNSLVKNRVILNNKIICRIDNIKKIDKQNVLFFNTFLERFFIKNSFDAIIISDYDKGTVTENIIKIIKKSTNLIVVDSKRKNLKMFNGCDILKINQHEKQIQDTNKNYIVESLFNNCVITNGYRGAELRTYKKLENNKYRIDSLNIKVDFIIPVDVTGCGDTHTAAIVYSLLKNNGNLINAIKFANKCASSVVGKFGTSTSNIKEIL